MKTDFIKYSQLPSSTVNKPKNKQSIFSRYVEKTSTNINHNVPTLTNKDCESNNRLMNVNSVSIISALNKTPSSPINQLSFHSKDKKRNSTVSQEAVIKLPSSKSKNLYNEMMNNVQNSKSLSKLEKLENSLQDCIDQDQPDGRKLRKLEKICDSDTEDEDGDPDKDQQWVILPDNPYKSLWDLVISIIILYSSIVTPYKVSFTEKDNAAEQAFDIIFSIVLAVDIVLNFFSAYIDKEDNIMKNHKQIIKTYLKTWFVIDVFSVFPFNYIIPSSSFSAYGTIARVTRIPRIYRLIRLFKLIRMVKLLKATNVNRVTKFFFDLIKVSANFERLIYFIFAFLLLNHIAACIWYYMAKLQDLSPDCWVTRLGYIDATNIEIYIVSFYWTLTTVTTVGYGDINAGTTVERLYNLILMSFGVIMYSFAIGSLSSIVSTLDNKTAEMNQKLQILSSIKKEFNLDQDIYDKVRKVIKYDLSRNQKDKMNFLQELPNKLRIELSQIMHDNVIQKLYFFRNQPTDFLAYVAPLLKPVKFSQNDFLYKCNDIIDEMYFVSKGTIVFCLSKDYNEKELKEIKKYNNFGEIEMCLNEKLTHNIKVKSRSSELFVLKKNDFLKLSMNFWDFIEKFLHKSLIIYLKFSEEKTKIVSQVIELKRIQNEIRGITGKEHSLEKIEEKEENSIGEELIDSENSESISSQSHSRKEKSKSEDDEINKCSAYDSSKSSFSSSNSSSSSDDETSNQVGTDNKSKKDDNDSNANSNNNPNANADKHRKTYGNGNLLGLNNMKLFGMDESSLGKSELKPNLTLIPPSALETLNKMDMNDHHEDKDKTPDGNNAEALKIQMNQKFVKKVNKIIDFLEKNHIELGNKNDNILELLKKLLSMNNLTERNEIIEKIESIVNESLLKKGK